MTADVNVDRVGRGPGQSARGHGRNELGVSSGGRVDPRLYQISILSLLLGYGCLRLDFDIDPLIAGVIIATALGAQYLCTRIWRLPAFDPRSALISSLSLCLLLRTNLVLVAVAAAALAVASKFVLKWNGKHVFNPTNFSLVLVISSGVGWVSSGQWGREAFFAFLIACLGGLVVNRAARSDVTYAFLGWYGALLFVRALWLGDPMSIPIHQLQNGALLIFAFLMISDPKTTPDSRGGRVLYGLLVALGAGFVQFGLYRPNGLLWSLVCCAVLVPFIDRWLPGTRYVWARPTLDSSQLTHVARAPVQVLNRESEALASYLAPSTGMVTCPLTRGAEPHGAGSVFIRLPYSQTGRGRLS